MMSQSPALSLDNLPQELIDRIIYQLSDRANLSHLSGTSKDIRATTLESLYEDITMVWNRKAGGHENPRIDLLLRTVVEEPKYADYISKIDLQPHDHRINKPRFSTTAASPSHVARVKAALRRLGVDRTSVEERLEAGVLRNDFNAIVALLLLLCLEITSLTLGLEILVFSDFLSAAFKYALPTQHSKHISRLQSPPISSSLTTLRLPETTMGPKTLHKILSSRPDLVTLEYDCWMYHHDQFDAFVLSAALEAVKNTCVNLNVKVRWWSEEDENYHAEDLELAEV
ncbi:hypothetical protein BDV96DRAFT_656725 [Lophiotrema nucula]|uniref:F-box domain-containing protein n=1 Tax=Lophiotrema nucula TaxID=690887 RepID=A0A6A5ZW28_9PLEO|nr:hypothetical protein BDV96DRAFT_656725 [Lophiotrema nucula]